MIDDKFKNLKRDLSPMPDFVMQSLKDSGLLGQFQSRPAYQQNDYLSWIIRAKRQETKDKRLNQMLNELREGHLYMKMKYKPL